jgi:hypothetical protein
VWIVDEEAAAIAAGAAVHRVVAQIDLAALLIAIAIGAAQLSVALHGAATTTRAVRELARLAARAAVLQRVERGLAAVLGIVIAVFVTRRAAIELALTLHAARARMRKLGAGVIAAAAVK